MHTIINFLIDYHIHNENFYRLTVLQGKNVLCLLNGFTIVPDQYVLGCLVDIRLESCGVLNYKFCALQ